MATALQSRERELCLGQEHPEGASQHMTAMWHRKEEQKTKIALRFGVYTAARLLKYGRNNLGRLSSMRRGRCTLVLREDLLSRAPQAPDDTSPKHSALLGPPSVLQVLNELC